VLLAAFCRERTGDRWTVTGKKEEAKASGGKNSDELIQILDVFGLGLKKISQIFFHI